ncbi:MAG: hypothetical protein ACK4IX_08160, partial [Candidatus Sericytochromatia bacterium]
LFVIIHSFYFSGKKICDFNKEYPIDMINGLLDYISVRSNSPEILDLLNKNFSINLLGSVEKTEKERIRRSIDTFETKVKASTINLNKLHTSKQQTLLKNNANNTFDIASQLYWLKQKNLNILSEIIDRK